MEDEVYIDFENNQGPAINDTTLNQLQKLIKQEFKEKLELAFPIGHTYTTQTDVNPNTILGFGTWERVKGKVLVGLDEDDDDFNEIGKEGGNKISQQLYAGGTNFGFTENAGGYQDRFIIKNTAIAGSTERNAQISLMQPYKVVGYMWIRTA